VAKIPDFTDSELWVVRTTLQERYGHEVPVHLADTEIRLRPDAAEPVEVPAVFWRERAASFVVCKLGPGGFHARFFYDPSEHFAPGRDHYEDLADCVMATLRAQADDERIRGGAPGRMFNHSGD